MAMEVITTPDKAKRDQMFNELRNSDDANERQVVKFSGVEMVAPPAVDNTTDPPTERKAQYRSTWSVAYPTS